MDRSAKLVRDHRSLAIRSLGLCSFLGVLALLPGAASAQDCIRDPSPTGTSARVLPVESCGIEITLSIPDRCASESCGLIIENHGITLSAEITDRNTNSRRLGVDAGFIVAQPTARLNALIGERAFAAGDEMRLIAFAEEAIRELNVNPNRVHVAGFSQGGGVALRIACMRPDLIASVSLIAPAGGLPAGCGQSGLPVTGMMFTQSSQDQLVAANRTEGTVQRLVTAMGLTPADGTVVKTAENGAAITRFMNGPQTLQFFRHNFTGASVGGGHCYPGSFEGPQPNGDLTPEELDARLATSDDPPETLQFACDDARMLRVGEEQIEFFLQNQGTTRP
jgi:poly(3-hydroxybutyrate) depolymerase